MSNYDNSRVILRGGVTLGFRDDGSGRALLLLHGLNSHSGTWRKNAPYFAGSRRVIAPSLPPLFRLRGAPPVEEYAEAVRQLLAELALTRVSVVGNSMGGWVASRVAEASPGVVDGLVLEDTAGVREDEGLGERLGRTGIPVLIVWGENDDVIAVEAGRRLHSDVKGSELVVFKETGHVPHWEKSSEFNAVVDRFLGSRSP